jgi:4-alpha-glucanotransferase
MSGPFEGGGEAFSLRRAGLLVPVFALRHAADFGIGDTVAVSGAAAFCARNGFQVLQILPIHETIGDHSPYNPVSSRALSPALLSLDPAEVPGLSPELLEEWAPAEWREQLRHGMVKHGVVHQLKTQVLQAAHRNFMDGRQRWKEEHAGFRAFKRQEAAWLVTYLHYRLLVREYEGNPDWRDWRPVHQSPADARRWVARHPERRRLERVMDGFAFAQWVADWQWRAVRRECESLGVLLMGEMSFGVGHSSVDVWSERQLFDLDWCVGSPPLAAFDTSRDSELWGQNWGLPACRWEQHRADGHAWLRGRVAFERRYFHLLRLDHLRGYFRGYLFPWHGGARHAEFASLSPAEAAALTGGKLPKYSPGPDDDPSARVLNESQGREAIRAIQEAAGGMGLVAEIMGDFPDYMRQVLEEENLASLVFPQLEPGDPSTFRELALASYANHDHAPLAMLYPHLLAQAQADPNGPAGAKLRRLLAMAGLRGEPPEALDDDLLGKLQKALLQTPCRLAVFLCSDLLGIPLRFNLPGSHGAETWCERLDLPLEDYESHPDSGPLIRRVRTWIQESGRGGTATPAP